MDVCWTCIAARRANTAAARAGRRTCERHRVARPRLVRTSSDQARAGNVKRPQQRAGAPRQPQLR